MDNEVWKSIKGYEDAYEVSNKGRVRSLERLVKNKKTSYKVKGFVKSLTAHYKNKYLSTMLYKDGKGKRFLVHRLVGLHFIKNPKSLKEINHKNGVKSDNYVENLEWVSRSENATHMFETSLGCFGEAHHNTTLKVDDVLEIKTMLLEGKSAKEISKRFDIGVKVVYDIRKERTWKHVKLGENNGKFTNK